MKLELSLIGTLLYILGVVESSSSSFYDKDDYYKIPQFVYEPFSMSNPMLRYYFRLDPEQSHEANERFVNRGSFNRNHIESRPGSFQEAIPYRATVTKSVEDERVPLRDAVEHIPIVGEMNILVRSGGNDGGSSDDGPFSRSSVEAFPSPITPYRSQYDDQEVNAIVSQVSITRDNYPRIGYRGDVEALITTPNENPLLKYYRVPDTNSISAVDNIWTRYMSAEHRPLTKSNPSNSQSYPWRNPTITKESMGDAYKVVCYFESWAVYRPKPLDFDIKDIDPFACTHLIYSFAGLDEKNFTIISLDHTRDIVQGAYKATIALKERNPDLKVMIALGGWAEGGLKYSQMVSTPERRKAFLDSLGTFMDQHGFDGVDLDWEYPGATDRGGVLADKENVAILCENIKEMFASKGRILTMAVPIAKIRIDDGYDVSRLSNCLDFFNLMSYDLRGPWDGVVDHHSPISQRRTDKHIHRGLNLHDGIQLFVNEGAPKNKIVVGIPLYGRSFTLETPLKATPGSLSVSMGNEGPYTKEKGYIAYYEVCILQRNGGWQITRDEAGGPYMHKDDQWIGYDNEKYVEEKVNFAKKEKLGGVMMWAIDLDDYLGMCGKRWPLMSSIRRTLASSAVDLGAPEIQELVLTPAIAEKVEDTKPVRETTPEAVSIILPEQTVNLPVDQSAIAVSGPAHGKPCNAGNSIFAQSSSSCSAFLICNQGSYEERHCSEGLHWNNVKHICDWPKNVQCTGDMQVPPGQADTPVSIGRPGESSGPTTELEYVGPSSTKLSGDFKVVCYFTNFAVERPGLGKYEPKDIDETLCTHVVYAFAVLDDINLIIKTFDSAVDIDTKFYEKVTALKAKGIKVTLAIGGWVDSAGDKYSRLVNNPAARQRFVSHVVEFIKKYNFDGLDLDWEFPVCWQIKCDKGPASDKEGFTSLVRELSAAFKPTGLLLSAAVSPSKKIIDFGYDVPTLSKYFDWISVMTYDFHGAWDKKTGHGAPMYHHPDDDLDYFNTDFAIRYWIEKGADKRKIVMGMPMYGRAFTLNDASINGLNSPAAAGKAGEFTKSAGFLAYYEICNSIKYDSWTVVQDPERRMGPYAYRGNQWISFDDVDTIRRKSQYIRDMGLGGGMIWALDLDDFTNRCGQGRHPLLSTIKNVLGPAFDFSIVVPPPTQPLDHPPQPDPPQVPGIQQPPPRPQTVPQTFPKPPQVEQPQESGDGYKVVCYFTNWAWYREGEGKYLPADVDPSLCTHINYAFAVLNQDTLLMKPHDTWADIDNNFYLKMSDLKKYGAKVLIALGGWNDSSGGKYSKLVNDPAARSRFNQHALEFIQKYNFDGLDLDWEYPKCWQVNCKLGPESDKDGFSAWIMELNALFQPYGLLLTAAVSPSFTVINAGYDVPVLSKYLDIINVMNYDYHGQWDKVTGHVAPMYEHPDDVEPKFNTDFTINYWIQLGADPKKLVLGMPMYGQSFTLTSPTSNGLNAPTYGGGEAGPYTRARGFLSYYEICYFIKHQDWTVVRDPLSTMGPYAYRGQTWVSFDDIPQIEYKSNYIKKMGLGGAMIWALDLDDFRNRCGCESYPLLKTINRVLRNYPAAASSCPLLGGGTVAAISANSEATVKPVLPPVHRPKPVLPPVHRPKPVLPSVKPPPSEQSHPPIAEGPEFPEENNLGEQGQAAQPQFPPGYDERPKPVSGGVCASGEFVKHHDCSKFYECYKGKLQEKSCPKGSLWDGKRACRRSSDVNCQSVVQPPTRVEKPPTRVEKPPTRVERPPTRVEKPPTRVEKPPTRLDPVDHIRPEVPSRVEISSIGTKQNNEIGASGQPCESGQFKRHQLCVKFYECVAGSFLERTCVPGLQWDGQARCNWPNKVNCVDILNIQNNPPPLPLPFTKEPPYPASKTTVWSTTQPTTRRSTTYWPTSSMITPGFTPAGIQAHPPAPTTFEPRPTAASTWWGATEATTPAWTHPPGSLEVDGYKVVCYFTNWAWYRQGIAKYRAEDIDPNLCTHIIYGFAVLDSNTLLIKTHDSWADIDNKYYQKVANQKQHGTKVLLAIGGWNDSKGGKYSKLVNDPSARRRFIEHVVQFIKKYNFDGLDLDWEYPKCWQVDCTLGPDSDKEGFTAWIRELKAAFEPYNWLLTAAVSPSYKVMDAGYDIPALSRYLDFINVMTYDYHGHWDKMTGHVAPMFDHPDSPAPEFNANYTIHYWIEKGADRKKLIMGMPLYGQAFTLSNTKDVGLNSPGSKGQAGEYTRAAGFLAYYEICDRVKNKGYTMVRDPSGTIGPYAYKGNQWVGFDDVTMIRFKSNYIKQMGLGGGMVWALDLDDFNNRCNCEPHPLLRTIRRELRNDYPVAATMDCSLS